jgi:hypothetical protein
LGQPDSISLAGHHLANTALGAKTNRGSVYFELLVLGLPRHLSD